jgi:tripartite-type tricarboxylate transporter receptor subunit TctC
MAMLRSCVKALAVFCLVLQLPERGGAQNFPAKTVRYVVPDSAGSGGDVFGRIIAAGLSDVFGQQVIVDNRTGAASNLGADIVARAAPDGYTLLAVSSTLSANVSLYRNLPYDLVRDLAPVTQMGFTPFVLVVHPSMPLKTVDDLIRLAKAKPGAINYSSAGTGTATFIAGELFKGVVGVNIVHVPYKGGGPALAEVLAGQVQALFSLALAATPHVKAGKVRALAITSARRSAVAPELPTVAELGFAGFEVVGWFGWLAPARTPREIVARLNAEIVKSLKLPEVRGRLLSQSAEPVGNSPQAFAAFIRSEHEQWARVIRRAGIRLD